MITETTVYLGPAEVLTQAEEAGFIEIKFPDGRTCWARLALAAPYNPNEGDEVLAIRQDRNNTYVIGVLRGHGTTTIRVPGDLNLIAPNGGVCIQAAKALRLRGGTAVEVTTPRATVRASRLLLSASVLVQDVVSAFTWASGLLQTKSKRLRQVSEEGWFVRAGRAHIKTRETASINGKAIHLG